MIVSLLMNTLKDGLTRRLVIQESLPILHCGPGSHDRGCGGPVTPVADRRNDVKARSEPEIMIWVKGIEAKASNML
jgi:hypothetical protein